MKYRLNDADKARIDELLDAYNLAKYMLDTYGDDPVNQYQKQMDVAKAEFNLIQMSVTLPF